MATGRHVLELTPSERAIAAASAIDSVRAEGLDPSGMVRELWRWVSGETTLTEVIQRELDDAGRVYGPAKSDRRAASVEDPEVRR